ncbi:hypothetical protein PCANC_15730 [Puccinia coronata f. sp. avenae]|uniref:Uncharacterized protein n=1 Tax=Puccinia coronata f. sp. avenae TaxID=200324 RepID=A0A2N5SMV7_9BASI|nr:hypothetical protein PCANC_15730 [Puccinia coronata f. sp. avenae]
MYPDVSIPSLSARSGKLLAASQDGLSTSIYLDSSGGTGGIVIASVCYLHHLSNSPRRFVDQRSSHYISSILFNIPIQVIRFLRLIQSSAGFIHNLPHIITSSHLLG